MKVAELEKSMFLFHLHKYGLNETQNLNIDIIPTFQAKDCALGNFINSCYTSAQLFTENTLQENVKYM